MFPTVHSTISQKGPGYLATSSTSLTIGTGSMTFTVQTALAYTVGARVRMSYASDGTKYMEGLCTAYNSSTGSMTVNVDTSASSGTFASWNVNLGGNPGTASFTPWTSNCDAGGFSLIHLGGLGLGTSSPLFLAHLNHSVSGANSPGAVLMLDRNNDGQHGGAIWDSHDGTIDYLSFGVGWGYNPTLNPILTIKATNSGAAGGSVGIGTTNPSCSGTGKVHFSGDTARIVDTARTPANSAAAGNDGEICWDASYIYVHVSGGWKRLANTLSTF